MSKSSNPELAAVVKIIVEALDPEQIILFGSRARGDARPNSDLDFLIVQSEPFSAQKTRTAALAALWRKLALFPMSKDLLLYSRDEVDYWRDSLNNGSRGR